MHTVWNMDKTCLRCHRFHQVWRYSVEAGMDPNSELQWSSSNQCTEPIRMSIYALNWEYEGPTERVSADTIGWRKSWNRATNCKGYRQWRGGWSQPLTYFVQVMGPVVQCMHSSCYDALNLIAARPLRITRMPINPPHVLTNFGFNRLQQEVVDRVHRIREYQLRPGQDTQFIAQRVEIINAPRNAWVRGLVSTASPNA